MDFTSSVEVGMLFHGNSSEEEDEPAEVSQFTRKEEDSLTREIEEVAASLREKHVVLQLSTQQTPPQSTKSESSMDGWEQRLGLTFAEIMKRRNKFIKVYFFTEDRFRLLQIDQGLNLREVAEVVYQTYCKEKRPEDPLLELAAVELHGYREGVKQQLDEEQLLSQSAFEDFMFSVKKTVQLKFNSLPNPAQFRQVIKQSGQLFFHVTNVTDNREWRVLIQEDKTVEQLLAHLAKLQPQQFRKQMVILCEGRELPSDEPLTRLNSSELMLVANRTSQLRSRASTKAEQSSTISSIRAFAYEQFQLIKVNRRNEREVRIIGVDSTQIYKKNPAAMRKSFFNSLLGRSEQHGSRKAEYQIADIKSIELGPNSLTLEFGDCTLKLEGSLQVLHRLEQKIKMLLR